jgi:uncharacterized protein (TIGR00251 family)
VKDDLELTPLPEGTRLRLRVTAGAKKTAIVGAHGGALKLSVTAVPERGRANRAVMKLLADALGLPTSAVTISSGKSSPDKVAEIALDVSAICAKLAELGLPKKR